MHPKAILLDWDGTLSLIRFWGHWRESRPADFEVIQRRVFQENKPLVHAWMRGELRSEDVCAQLEHDHGWPAKELMQELELSCSNAKLTHNLLLEKVSEARSRNMKVLIATDNMDTFARWTVPALGLNKNQFDDIVNSSDLGVLKTDVDSNGRLPFFDQIFENHHLQPADCILIDDGRTLQPLAKKIGLGYRLVDSQTSAYDHLLSFL